MVNTMFRNKGPQDLLNALPAQVRKPDYARLETEHEEYTKRKHALFKTLNPTPKSEPVDPRDTYNFSKVLEERNAMASRITVQKAFDQKIYENKKKKLTNAFNINKLNTEVPLLTALREKLENPDSMKGPRFDLELELYLSDKDPDVSIQVLDAQGLKLAAAQKEYSGCANIRYLWSIHEKFAQLGNPILFAKADQGKERIAILPLQDYGMNAYIAVSGNPAAVECIQKELSGTASSTLNDKQIRNHTKFGWIRPQESGLEQLHKTLADSEYGSVDIRTIDSRILLNQERTGTQYWIAGASPITLEDDMRAIHACAEASTLANGASIVKVNDRIAYKTDGQYHVAPADQLQDVYAQIYQTPIATTAFTPTETSTKTPLTGKWTLHKANTVLCGLDYVDFIGKNFVRRIEKDGKNATCTEYRV